MHTCDVLKRLLSVNRDFPLGKIDFCCAFFCVKRLFLSAQMEISLWVKVDFFEPRWRFTSGFCEVCVARSLVFCV